MASDIIAAIATAWGESGIAIVRLSGEGSTELVDRIFRGRRPLSISPPWHLCYGHLVDSDGETLDEVLAVRFAAPKSYTGEEAAEIYCHGGLVPAQTCLERLIDLGARLAHPGEFTQRAFLNGRIDLSEAEAVLGVIQARNTEALKAAARNLQGKLSCDLKSLWEKVLDLSSQMEAGLDFPEEDLPPLSGEEILQALKRILSETADLLERCRRGFLLGEGIRVALVGRPNVGKSSLLNALAREPKAIVTSIPGTTRDLVEATVSCRGVPLRFIDMAGLRSPRDPIEAIGIQRAHETLKKADIRVWVIDSSEPLTEEDHLIAKELEGTTYLVAINKNDLEPKFDSAELAKLVRGTSLLYVSSLTGEGIETLLEAIVEKLLGSASLEGGIFASQRQIEELKTCLAALKSTEEACLCGLEEDVAAECLGEAREALARLLGLEADASLLEAIFSRFCIGK